MRGGKIPLATNNTDGLLSKMFAIESVSLYGKKAILIHKTKTNDYEKLYFRAHMTKEASFSSGDCSFYVTGSNRNKAQVGNCQYKIVAGMLRKSIKLYFKKDEDNSLSIYVVSIDGTFEYFGFVKENLDGVSTSSVQTLDDIDISSLTEINKM